MSMSMVLREEAHKLGVKSCADMVEEEERKLINGEEDLSHASSSSSL